MSTKPISEYLSSFSTLLESGAVGDSALERLVNDLQPQLALLATSQKGSKQLERVVEHLASKAATNSLFASLLERLSRPVLDSFISVCSDQYGAYVLQSILQASPDEKPIELILNQLRIAEPVTVITLLMDSSEFSAVMRQCLLLSIGVRARCATVLPRDLRGIVSAKKDSSATSGLIIDAVLNAIESGAKHGRELSKSALSRPAVSLLVQYCFVIDGSRDSCCRIADAILSTPDLHEFLSNVAASEAAACAVDVASETLVAKVFEGLLKTKDDRSKHTILQRCLQRLNGMGPSHLRSATESLDVSKLTATASGIGLLINLLRSMDKSQEPPKKKSKLNGKESDRPSLVSQVVSQLPTLVKVAFSPSKPDGIANSSCALVAALLNLDHCPDVEGIIKQTEDAFLASPLRCLGSASVCYLLTDLAKKLSGNEASLGAIVGKVEEGIQANIVRPGSLLTALWNLCAKSRKCRASLAGAVKATMSLDKLQRDPVQKMMCLDSQSPVGSDQWFKDIEEREKGRAKQSRATEFIRNIASH